MLKTNDLMQLISKAKGGFENYKSVFDELSRAYLMRYRKEVKENLRQRNKSSIFIPLTPSKTRRILASFQESYFTNDNIVKIEQVLEYPNLNNVIEILQKAFNHYTQKEIKLFSTLSKNMLEAIIYGTPIMRVYWNGAKVILENVSIYNIFLDNEATSNDDLNYLVHKIYLSKAQIYRFIELGVFTPESEVTKESEILKLYERVELNEVYYRLNDSWYCATLWDRNKLRDIPLQDGLPFIVGNLLPQLDNNEKDSVRLYGESPISIILSTQQEINTRRNQQIDAIDLALNPRVLLQQGGGIDPFAFKRGAGEIITCIDPNAVKFFTPPSINEANFDIQKLDLEAQEAVGVTAYNSGVNSSNLNQTATGMSILSTEANTRIQSIIRSYNETFIEPMLTRVAKLIYKYDTKFFSNIPIKPPLDFIAKINTGLGATNPQLQLQNVERAFSMMERIQNIQGMIKLTQEALPLLSIKNVEDYFAQDTLNNQQFINNQGLINGNQQDRTDGIFE